MKVPLRCNSPRAGALPGYYPYYQGISEPLPAIDWLFFHPQAALKFSKKIEECKLLCIPSKSMNVKTLKGLWFLWHWLLRWNKLLFFCCQRHLINQQIFTFNLLILLWSTKARNYQKQRNVTEGSLCLWNITNSPCISNDAVRKWPISVFSR